MTLLFLMQIIGAGMTNVPVDATLLADLPIVEAKITAHEKTQICSGPTLASILSKVGVPQGKDIRGDALLTGITAKARDGYSVLFSLGEIDPMLGGKTAIVATTCNGMALPAEDGPYRLVLPGEKRAARSVRQLEALEIVTSKTVPKP